MIGEYSSKIEESDDDEEEEATVNVGPRDSGLKKIVYNQNNDAEDDPSQEGEKAKHGLEWDS